MGIILYNPTNEELKGMSGGIDLILPPEPEKGHMVKVDDAKGRHILNQLGPRGLTSLEYGDDSDGGKIKLQKAEAGRRRNREFKMKQIERYNQDNEARKAQHQAYVKPPPHIEAYAKELGEGLIAPYQVQDHKNKEIAVLTEKLEKRDNEFAELSAQFKEFMKAFKEGKTPQTTEEIAGEAEEAEKQKLWQEYKMLPWVEFKKWVNNPDTVSRYPTFPVESQGDIRKKWAKLADEGELFPY